MKKLLYIIFLITSLFSLSCNHNKVLSPSYIGEVGEITVDPYKLAPLSAVYRTETVNGVPITVKVKGLYGEPDIIHTYPAGYGTEFPIHGMFPESQNIIEVNDGGRIITKNVNVGTISENGITIQKKYDAAINNLQEEKYTNNPELYFLSANWSFMIGISKNGYVRYFMPYYGAKIAFENKNNVFYPADEINNIDLLGKKTTKYPTITHHDTILVKDHYLYLSGSTWGIEDRLVEIDNYGNKKKELSFAKLIQNSVDLQKYPEDEEILKKIVFSEDINNIYTDSSGQQKSIDWFHGNSLVYDSSTDILYVSSRHRGVLAIDYSEWKLIWWMADNKLATIVSDNGSIVNSIPYNLHFKDLKSLEPYRVKGDALNDGPKNQHALFLHKNDNLGMFDNQGDEDTNPNGSRYVEYKITGTYGNYTAQKVYEYIDPSLYSRIMSDVDFTGDYYQNILITYGYLPSGKVIEVQKNTKTILFNLNVPFPLYRADKMPLYYDEGRVYSEDCNLKNPN